MVAILMLALFFVGSTQDSFTLFVRPWAGYFGSTIASVSLVVSIQMLVAGVTALATGVLVDRYGAKRVLVGQALLLSVAALGIATMTSLWHLYFFGGVVIGVAYMMAPAYTRIVASWFERHRGLAFSLVTSGHYIGLAAMAPVIVIVTAFGGWRLAWVTLGAAILLLLFPLVAIVVRSAPRTTTPGQSALSSPQTRRPGEAGLSLAQACGASSFWLMILAYVVCGGTVRFFMTYMAPIALEGGLNSTLTGFTVSLASLAVVPGLLVFGPASDRVSQPALLGMNFFLRGLGFLLMVLFLYTGLMALMLVGVVLTGFTIRATEPVFNSLLIHKFGITSLGTLVGIAVLAHQISGALAAFLGGLSFDATGSYALALMAGSLLLAMEGFAAWRIPQKRLYPQVASSA